MPNRTPAAKSVEVEILTAMAGEDFSWGVGDVVEMDRATAARALAVGYVDVEDAALRRALKREGADFAKERGVALEDQDPEDVEELARLRASSDDPQGGDS